MESPHTISPGRNNNTSDGITHTLYVESPILQLESLLIWGGISTHLFARWNYPILQGGINTTLHWITANSGGITTTTGGITTYYYATRRRYVGGRVESPTAPGGITTNPFGITNTLGVITANSGGIATKPGEITTHHYARWKHQYYRRNQRYSKLNHR